MEFLVLTIALIALNMLALRYGVDSRHGIGNPRLVECRVRTSI